MTRRVVSPVDRSRVSWVGCALSMLWLGVGGCTSSDPDPVPELDASTPPGMEDAGTVDVVDGGPAPDPTVPVQTVLRFDAAAELSVPGDARIQLWFHPHGTRQYENAMALGDFAFEPDIKLVVDAADNDLTRRFTVFAELLDGSGQRLSWARIRTGFGPAPLSEVRVVFAPGCLAPPDRPGAEPDEETCGSHDTCVADADGSGVCAEACYPTDAFDEDGTRPATVPTPCAGSDCLVPDALEAGWDATCAMIQNEVFCWGQVAFGRAGTDFMARPTRPRDTNGNTRFDPANGYRSASLSIWQVCVVRESGVVQCGGDDNGFVLGVTVDEAVPCCSAQATTPTTFTKVAARAKYTCALEETEGALWCTGDHPLLPAGQWVQAFESVLADDIYDDLVAARDTVCGVTDDTLNCLGPTLWTGAIPPYSRIRSASSATYSACMVDETGELICWGRDVAESVFADQPTSLGSGWSGIALPGHDPGSTDAAHWCGIREEGSLWCWGQNEPDGPAGVDPTAFTFVPQPEPAQVGRDVGWTHVVVGRHHTCGIRDQRLYCWGSNYGRQLGVTAPPGPEPVEVCVPAW